MVWNAVNDVLFGWLSDRLYLGGGGGDSGADCAACDQTGAHQQANAPSRAGGLALARRIPSIKYGGPLWALSFVLTWVPWSGGGGGTALAGLHFGARGPCSPSIPGVSGISKLPQESSKKPCFPPSEG
mgnify:CR=1 FL=1